MSIVAPDDLIRAARGERVPGLTHSLVDGVPLGPGPLTPAGWRAFEAARRRGFLATAERADYGALGHLWRRWCAAHGEPEVAVQVRELGRQAVPRPESQGAARAADALLTLDRNRRVLAPAGLLAVAEALVRAGVGGEDEGCHWFLSPAYCRVGGAPEGAAEALGAALLRVGRDERLTCPGSYVEFDPEALQRIAERRHQGG